jgi:hypothetical protein
MLEHVLFDCGGSQSERSRSETNDPFLSLHTHTITARFNDVTKQKLLDQRAVEP